MQTIEAMASQMAALQTQAAEPRDTPTPGLQKPTGKPATAIAPTTAEATPPPPLPTQVVIPTPAGPGICGRSPEIQTEILEQLKAPLCQAITTQELFRVTHLSSNLTMRNVKAGDFKGLVNLHHLTMAAKDVEVGAFLGLNNLERLDLTVYTYGSLATRAFQGLNALETLKVSTSKPDSGREDTLKLPDFDHLPKLHTLYLDGASTIRPDHLTGSFLKNLPDLQHLEIQVTRGPESNIFLAKDLFAKNPKLKTLHIMGRGYYEAKLHLPENLFENNASLENLLIEGTGTAIPERLLKDLQELETFKTDYVDENQRHQIQLSEDSPLYKEIARYNDDFHGYTVVRVGDS